MGRAVVNAAMYYQLNCTHICRMVNSALDSESNLFQKWLIFFAVILLNFLFFSLALHSLPGGIMKARTHVDMQNTMLLNAKEKRRFCFSVIVIWNSISGMVSLLDSTSVHVN